jgi:2-methylcitrate dehydratase PrpD
VAACALERDLAFGEAVAAAAVGYELLVRVAEAAGPEHRQRWHVTATAGTVGAAGAAARALGGDDDACADAVAHAISLAGGAAHAIFERTTTRFLHRAHATATGLACARAACAGKRASRHVLDDGRGGTFAPADRQAFAARLSARRASTAVTETGFRLHAATGFAHSAIDAALLLGPVAEVENVRVGVSAIAATLASNPAPRGAEEEWWSIEHAVAATLATDPARIDVEPSAEGWGAIVEATLRDGSTRSASVTEPLGHPDRPASDDDLRAKWVRLGATDGATAFDRIASAGEQESFAALLRDAVPALA